MRSTAIDNLHNQLVVNDGVELSVEAMREGVKRTKEGKQGVAEKVLTFNQWVDEFIKETERGERTNQKGFAITAPRFRNTARFKRELPPNASLKTNFQN